MPAHDNNLLDFGGSPQNGGSTPYFDFHHYKQSQISKNILAK